MKKTILVAMSLSALIAFNATSTFAHEDEAAHKKTDKKETEHKHAADGTHVDEPKKSEGSHGHEHATKVPDTVEGIWKKINEKQEQLVKTVADKKLSSAHDPAFAIRDLAKAFPAKVAESNRGAAQEGASDIAKIAADIDKSSAAGAQKATEGNVKKMGARIKALQAKLQAK
jgi:hypothetical protein